MFISEASVLFVCGSHPNSPFITSVYLFNAYEFLEGWCWVSLVLPSHAAKAPQGKLRGYRQGQHLSEAQVSTSHTL